MSEEVDSRDGNPLGLVRDRASVMDPTSASGGVLPNAEAFSPWLFPWWPLCLRCFVVAYLVTLSKRAAEGWVISRLCSARAVPPGKKVDRVKEKIKRLWPVGVLCLFIGRGR
ncbi:hypothetical protein GCM10020229_35400 [Kitasatospora albolonga]